jgi:sigma-B regulation protein RsbU (phosphoserine phosphatase)
MTFDKSLFTQPLVTGAPPSRTPQLGSQQAPAPPHLSSEERRAAEVLIRHLFASEKHSIDGLEYHVAYALADGAVGGDIVDIYHFDNGNVSLAIADISGKGATAAIHAALVKYGLRCYASEGLTAESVLRSLDRAYIENNAFERTESFASVFLAILDHERRSLAYASAGHEPVMLCRPGEPVEVLPPTAPLIGVFDDQHHLFKQRHIEIEPGTVLVATTDGVTEARSSDGGFFGMERLVPTVARAVRTAPAMDGVIDAILREVEAFCGGRLHDDIAVFAVRIF